MSINVNKGIGSVVGGKVSFVIGRVPMEQTGGEDVTLAEGVVLRGVTKMPIVKWTDDTHVTLDFSNGGRIRELEHTSKKIKVSSSF